MRSGQFLVFAALVFCTVFLSGCLKDGQLAWSPDGQWLAVNAADGLRLAKADGSIGAPAPEHPTRLTWYPDGKLLLVCKTDKCTSWEALEKLLPEDEKVGAIATAETLKNSLLACKGDFKACQKDLQDKKFSADFLPAALLYLKDKQGAALANSIEAWKTQTFAPVVVSQLKAFSVADGKLGSPQLVRSTANEVSSLRVSPDGQKIAYVDEAAGDKRLVVVNAGNAKVIARLVSAYPDWTPDSNTMVFLCGDDNLKRVGLVGAPAEKLCSARFEPEGRVRCLKDGTILFSNSYPTDVSRPDFIGESKVHMEVLWRLEPGTDEPVVLAKRQHNNACGLCVFELSPDQKQVTVPDSYGPVEIMNLANRELTKIRTTSGDPSFCTPVWRTNDEVTFTEQSAHDKDVQRVLSWNRQTSKTEALSKDWPHEAIVGLLEKTDEEEEKLTLDQFLNDIKIMAPIEPD